jgi:hypothetical protein
MSEARKYHLNLIVANQFTTQLSEEIRDAVFGNIGTIVGFRVGQDEDAEALAKRFRPAFDTSDLLRVPNYNTVVRTLVGGVPTQPFSMATLPPLGDPNDKLAGALKQLSAVKYGRPKAQVEKEIFARLATKADPIAAPRPFAANAGGPGGFGSFPPSPPMGPGPQAPPSMPSQKGSFLDEWLTKRETNGPLLRPNPWDKGKPQSTNVPDAPSYTMQPAPMPPIPPAPPAAAVPPMPVMAEAPQQTNQYPPLPAPGPIGHVQRPSATGVEISEPIPVKRDDTSGEISLQKRTAQAPEDTIYIDQDGNLHARS